MGGEARFGGGERVKSHVGRPRNPRVRVSDFSGDVSLGNCWFHRGFGLGKQFS